MGRTAVSVLFWCPVPRCCRLSSPLLQGHLVFAKWTKIRWTLKPSFLVQFFYWKNFPPIKTYFSNMMYHPHFLIPFKRQWKIFWEKNFSKSTQFSAYAYELPPTFSWKMMHFVTDYLTCHLISFWICIWIFKSKRNIYLRIHLFLSNVNESNMCS